MQPNVLACQGLYISNLWVNVQESRHFQPAIYAVFHEESESELENHQILHPEEEIKKTDLMKFIIPNLFFNFGFLNKTM